MKYIIGIDDTDNLESRGTGHLARVLGEELEKAKMIKMHSIVRHQLLVDPRIPYTPHNSSASLLVNILCDIKKIIQFCRELLIRESAEGSDVGLCVADWNDVSDLVTEWGSSAKMIILKKNDALLLAERSNFFLEGLRGTKDGIIGSLAAVGLRKLGNDGRLLWLKGMREINGIFGIAELKEILGLDAIVDREMKAVSDSSLINTGEWLRPVMFDGRIVLIADKSKNKLLYEWEVASKEYIKSFSE